MNFERIFRAPDLFSRGWEAKWPQVAVAPDGSELRADCELTPEECATILRTGELVSEGATPQTHDPYEIWQLPGHFGNARVMRIHRLSVE